MRFLLAALVIAALGAYLAACGDASKSTSSHRKPSSAVRDDAAVTAYFANDRNDRDNDGDHNDNDERIREIAERRAGGAWRILDLLDGILE